MGNLKKAYVVSAKRTAIGSFLGSLKDVPAPKLGAALVKAILEETGLPSEAVDEVIVGNVLSAGLGQGVARQVALHGGITHLVPAYAVNQVCCSGMRAVMNAVDGIRAGRTNIVFAGGVESMSQAPFYMPGAKIRNGNKLGDLAAADHILHDALTDAFDNIHMGVTAENIAAKYGIDRQAQDEFALESQKKALAAADAGHFAKEIVPVEIKVGRSETVFSADEYPNGSTSIEKLQALRPAFKKDGTVTAGNASGINDGASMTLIASEEAVKERGLAPMAEIIGVGHSGIEPHLMGLGPVLAIKNALRDAGLSLKDMELLELNEAFAAQALGVVHGLSVNHNMSHADIHKITNVSGGAISLGHPVGASGNRIITTLLHGLARMNLSTGLASLCAGGGMGTAVVFRMI